MRRKGLNREEQNKIVMEADALVVAEFYVDQRLHCQRMIPIMKGFEKLEKRKLEVVRISIEEENALADLYMARSILIFVLLRKGEAL